MSTRTVWIVAAIVAGGVGALWGGAVWSGARLTGGETVAFGPRPEVSVSIGSAYDPQRPRKV